MVFLLVGLVIGGLVGFAVTYSIFNQKVDAIQNYSPSPLVASYPNATYVIGSNTSLSTLYQQVKSSVVVIQDLVPQYNIFGGLAGYSKQQGSGFVANDKGNLVIVTNNHVITNAINVTSTFASGDSFPAKVLGSDPQADLAVLLINSMPDGIKALSFVSSGDLQVGDPVVAVGSPYGLSGTLTTGVISALGRTITETDESGAAGATISDLIQTSTAINPGNSGGPLIDYAGNVVGITTAGVSNSQSLGFAIPSDTIIREISSLVSTGSYKQHPSLEVTGTDMNYQIAQAMGTSVTYGFLVEDVKVQNGLRAGTTQASVLGSNVILGGDIIVGIGNSRITNSDDLLSYLERYTLPGQTANVTIVRDGQTQTIAVKVGGLP